MNFLKIIFFICLLITSCGTKPTSQYSIIVSKSSDFLKKGDKILLNINNPNNDKIQNIQFRINDSLIGNEYIINNKLGTNEIKASFNLNNKKFTISKTINVYSLVSPKLYSYKIINEFDHDISSYTQGLEFDDDFNLYESTGQYGFSSLIKIDYKKGEVLNKLFLDKSYFGEGLTIINDKLYQLTWKQKIGFVYNKDNFELIKSFDYDKSIEGWVFVMMVNSFINLMGQIKFGHLI